MKNLWLKGALIAGGMIILILAINYRESKNNVSLNEIFPEEHVASVNVEYVDEQSSDKSSTAVPSSAVIASKKLPAVQVQPEKSAEPMAPEVSKTAPVVSTAEQNNSAKKNVYTIQIASSKEESKSEQMSNSLKKKGLDSFVAPVNVKDKGTWYRVYIGKFSSKAEADQYLLTIKKDFPAGFVVTTKN